MRKLKINNVVNENAVFEKYTDFDLDIARDAKNFELYLIGGTAIDLYCNYYGIQSWRNRSNNDLDFWCSANDYSKAKEFVGKYTEKFNGSGFNDDYMISTKLLNGKIDLDVLIDYDSSNKKFCDQINGFNIMNPVYLFSSKFNRYLNTTNSERKERDFKDLQILLKLMEKRNEFDLLESYLSTQSYGEKEENELNNIISTLM